MHENPYASPLAVDEPVERKPLQADQASLIRRKNLTHEASVQQVGMTLYFIAAFLPVGAGALVKQWADAGVASIAKLSLIAGAVMLLAVPTLLVAARGLTKLDRRVRPLIVLLAIVVALWIPTGTFLSGCLLYLIFRAEAKYVFSPEYAEVRRQTPHLKYRTPIAMVLVILFAAGMMVFTAYWQIFG